MTEVATHANFPNPQNMKKMMLVIEVKRKMNLMTELKLMKMGSNGGKMKKANGGIALQIKKIGMLTRSESHGR